MVRIGIAGDDEYELIGDEIHKGKRNDSMSQLIVKPAPGYEIKFDIIAYKIIVVKVIAEPVEVSYLVKFKFKTEQDKSATESVLGNMAQWPGYVSLEKQP